MRTVYKYPLQLTDKQEIELPEHAAILHVGEQNGELCVWVLVNTENGKEPWVFYVCGTGHELRDRIETLHPAVYVGTVQMQNAPLVWHVFAGRS